MRFSSRPRSVRLEVAEGLNGPALGARAAQLLCDAWSARRLHLVERTCLAVHDHVAELAAKVHGREDELGRWKDSTRR